ncbi:DUF4180 domain-containing protein [Dyadobacter chenwenxiniae]|uniref:DUF4180 domain-containing protein n=1 Tax=Dyadobacter chenwenxiniae TaxID=2906456 RepID=A0A9X1THM0_9BACT|nr:DUF4180 domain-containing protein [Dyadobacter chenwenxiniae]MCF0065277.1 DUF4180 domain-containing protein [Dyadobacter chenwenxiniae]UON84455.1 DUF4180 domain-containing protein [Dyadobacter chenwenxiniae]
MEIKEHLINKIRIAEVISPDLIIHNIEDGKDLMGDLYYQGFDRIIIYQHNLTPAFFDLKSGIAGEILQKFSNYRIRLAIIGDFTIYTSKSLRDFIFESNNRKHVNFLTSPEEAIARFSLD